MFYREEEHQFTSSKSSAALLSNSSPGNRAAAADSNIPAIPRANSTSVKVISISRKFTRNKITAPFLSPEPDCKRG